MPKSNPAVSRNNLSTIPASPSRRTKYNFNLPQ